VDDLDFYRPLSLWIPLRLLPSVQPELGAAVM
jgi:hypothetical protein